MLEPQVCRQYANRVRLLFHGVRDARPLGVGWVRVSGSARVGGLSAGGNRSSLFVRRSSFIVRVGFVLHFLLFAERLGPNFWGFVTLLFWCSVSREVKGWKPR